MLSNSFLSSTKSVSISITLVFLLRIYSGSLPISGTNPPQKKLFLRMRGEVEEQEDEQSRVVYELCSMISHVLRSPPLPISFPGLVGPAVSSQASPAAFASLFLGISVALMLFGSVTFVIGFFLMPLVIGLVMLFYFVGLLYNLSELGRTILWPDCSPLPAWRFS